MMDVAAPAASLVSCLVADIGGTNARFSVAHVPSRGSPGLMHARVLRVAEYPDIGVAIRSYLSELPASERPHCAMLAVAAPVTGDHVTLTNSSWSFSTRQLQSELRMQSLQVINDFVALAWSLPTLPETDVEPIGESSRWTTDLAGDGTRVIVGPGTGLGVAAIRLEHGRLVVMGSEGGHAGFAPCDEAELALMHAMIRRHGRVSWERLLSGQGLLDLYCAVCERDDHPLLWTSPEQITLAAIAEDTDARAATHAFCAALGSLAGDLALTYCAWQGVYLAGGMLTHLFDDACRRICRERFEHKGRMSGLLATVPTLRIIRQDASCLGAAACFASAFDPN